VRVESVVEEHQRHPGRRHAVVASTYSTVFLAEDRHPVARRASWPMARGESSRPFVELGERELAGLGDERQALGLL